MAEFIAMGGYARFVWSAFFISFAVLTLMVWLTKRNYRRTLASLERRAAAAPAAAEVRA